MDAVYLLRHSPHADEEIRYSLRSLERHAPHIGKVWIFGDCPAFLTRDTSIAEHVPHAGIARSFKLETPVTNFFYLLLLSSLIPDLSAEYLRLSDDFILMREFPEEEARKVRYLQDLGEKETRGTGRWRKNLWWTYDRLKERGYTGYNFETHAPAYMRREWALDAFLDLKDLVATRWLLGVLGNTAILNHAHARHGFPLTRISEEGSRLGFWRRPPSLAQIEAASPGKTFLNFDDAAFGGAMRRFLGRRFPAKSKYER